MPGKIVNLSDLTKQEIRDFRDRYDVFFFDMDGTLAALNKDPIPGADRTVARLVELGKTVHLVTDNCLYTRKGLSALLRPTFPQFSPEQIITSPYTIVRHLKEIGFNKKIYAMGELTGLVQELIDAGFNVLFEPEMKKLSLGKVFSIPLEEGVGAVALGADVNFTYEKLFKAVNYLKDPAVDFYITAAFDTVNHNPIIPGAGGLAAPIRVITKNNGINCSKNSEICKKLIQSLGYDMKRSLFVGDGLINDIFCGNNCGMDTLLVMGGYTSKEHLEEELTKDRPLYIPKYLAGSVADLGDLYSSF